MANKKKIATATAAVAVAVAASLMLGGTFAWQSISQTALNEKEATVNPGGRLHDDFNGTNKDVYVENFAENDIFARVRLDEYFEIVMNKNTPAEKTEVVTAGATKDDTATYLTHKFDAVNATDDYWNWTTGGSTKYMPTFNKNKDSLVADINGTFEEDYADYVDYTDEANAEKTETEIYDGDSNDVDEVGSDFAHLETYAEYIKTVESQTHTVKETADCKGLISMTDWLALDSETDNYWVYDTDGWVYWSSPIVSNSATGLLLNEINLKNIMDDSYYYAINVVGQFITADDLGKEDNTGFYANGETVSDDALTLLERIGVTVVEDAEPTPEPDPELPTITAVTSADTAENSADVYLGPGESATYTFTSDGLKNSDVIWSYTGYNGDYDVEMAISGLKIEANDDEGCSATVTHTCESLESCSCADYYSDNYCIIKVANKSGNVSCTATEKCYPQNRMPVVSKATLYTYGYASEAEKYTGEIAGVDYVIPETTGVYYIATPNRKKIDKDQGHIDISLMTLGEGNTLQEDGYYDSKVDFHDSLYIEFDNADPGYYKFFIDYDGNGDQESIVVEVVAPPSLQ